MWSSEPLGVPGSILLVSGKRYGRKCVPCLPRKRTALRWLMHRTAFPVLSRRSMPAILLYGTSRSAFQIREAHRGKGGIGFRGIMKCIREKPNAGSMPPRTLFERKTGLDSHHCALRLEKRGCESRCPANPICMNTGSLPRDTAWQASSIFYWSVDCLVSRL